MIMKSEYQQLAALEESKIKSSVTISLMCVLSIITLLTASAAQGEGVLTVTLSFETEGLDLDAGVVTTVDIPIPVEEDGTDIRIAYNALRLPAAVVVTGATEGVELAFVAGVPFDGVTAESVAGLTFSAEPVDAPFSAADTVVVRTATGAVFKLGNASESDTGVTFNYIAL